MWLNKKGDKVQDAPPIEHIDFGEDIDAYEDAVTECREVFMNRRSEHGNHLEKGRRFPSYSKSGVYEKCVRIVEKIDRGEDIGDSDSTVDLVNYLLFELSRKHHGCSTKLLDDEFTSGGAD